MITLIIFGAFALLLLGSLFDTFTLGLIILAACLWAVLPYLLFDVYGLLVPVIAGLLAWRGDANPN